MLLHHRVVVAVDLVGHLVTAIVRMDILRNGQSSSESRGPILRLKHLLWRFFVFIENAFLRNLRAWDHEITRTRPTQLPILVAALLWQASLKSLTLAVLYNTTVYKLVFSWVRQGQWPKLLSLVLVTLMCVGCCKIVVLNLPS